MSALAPLRVVLLREADMWLAQGLEHDVGAQGEHLKDVLARLALALEAQDWRALGPAPAYFHVLWACRAGDYQPLEPLTLPSGDGIALGIVA
ncbi:hypothetical protein HT136_16745 [Novosphingobium profundi]|uniref:hypothetical protein n=1 Tax=Novosphingobium profundi TaxID=1774954 RepID=UPI001BDAF381|nr:hypothetical protein [Novosphingobium profundi]MBT0670015.1 hypothetical protein [Novosphingobium profundi]